MRDVNPLDPSFTPQSIAVIGASRSKGKIGYAVLANIVESGFRGTIYPVNPGADEILGWPAYPRLEAIEGVIDVAAIVIPAHGVLDVLEACGKRHVKLSIVITAGFRETGHEGMVSERKMAEIARRYHMRILGPNCLGMIDTLIPLNASFAAGTPLRGGIAFMSQSGALCTSVLDIAVAEEIGFAKFISLGNKADLSEVDFLEAWGNDPNSTAVMAYLEGITNGERFIQAARRVTKLKPVIAIKSGTTNAGSRAVSSHTGTLAGSERSYEAAFKQAGVIRAGSVSDLFDFAVAFERQPLPRNNKVVVVTNAGGPGIMTSDALERAGLQLTNLSSETMNKLRAVLPAAASVLNPVDVLGDAGAERYRKALNIVVQDPHAGAIITIFTPQFTSRAEETAQAVVEVAGRIDIPVLACFMGGANIQSAVRLLTRHKVPNYVVPEKAVAALTVMVEQEEWQQKALPHFESFPADEARIGSVFRQVRSEGRLQIGEAEARDILAAYHVPIPEAQLCRTAEEAVDFAEKIGYPVVMKIASPDILHKTDIGGVRLNVDSALDVRDSFDLITYRAQRFVPDAELWGCLVQRQVRGGKEIIIGMSRDPQFGPLIMFGLGGIYVEVLKDVSFRIAPFSRDEAEEMITEIRSFTLLQGVRGEEPADRKGIVDTLLKVSQLVTRFPEILELDINPLVVHEEGRGVTAIDMRLVLAS